jgi:putative tryptophan/tyrosine transport system substrate-binding protein
VKRREFFTLLGGAAVAWPVVVRAQQAVMPVIGFLGGTSPDTFADRLRALRQGLKDTASVPMVPPAPGRLSMMNGWPSRSCSH